MLFAEDPAEMTEEERFRQVVSILAMGLLRLRGCLLQRHVVSSKSSPELANHCLDVAGETVLSVSPRVNGAESRKHKEKSL